MIIDLPSDKGLAHFASLSRVLELPEFVKEADFGEQIETKDLPRDSFALPWSRQFPIHTKTAAYLSYAYFLSQAKDMPTEECRLCTTGFQKAAEFWSLKGEFRQIEASMNKKATVATSKYALILDGDPSVGPHRQSFFPINTPTEILKSAAELESNRGQFDFGLRSHAAKTIMAAGVSAGLPVTMFSDTMHKMAGHGITTKTAAMIELTARYDNEKRPSLSAPLHTCIAALDRIESELLGGEVCEKIATIIEKYDRSVRGTASFPEDVLFAFTKKAADRIVSNLVTLADGTSYFIDHLDKAADAFGVLGKNVVADLKRMDGTLDQVKVAELIETLPRTDVDILKSALETMGVKPAIMDKVAMVQTAVNSVQKTPNMTVLHKFARESRSDILAKLEAEDPLVKRALATLRRMKEAKHEGSPAARGIGGIFINKAANNASTSPVKK